MQIRQLRELISKTLTKQKVLKLIAIDFSIKDLIELTFDANQQIGFRAAWILENLLLTNLNTILDNLDEVLIRFPQVSNPSCQRHYVKILMYLTSPKTNKEIKAKMQVANLELIIETCFDWLIDPKVAVVVKVFCCETLFNLRNRYDWIADELAREIGFLMLDGSAAMQSKGKRILKELSK